jgi:hypothetical protein
MIPQCWVQTIDKISFKETVRVFYMSIEVLSFSLYSTEFMTSVIFL